MTFHRSSTDIGTPLIAIQKSLALHSHVFIMPPLRVQGDDGRAFDPACCQSIVCVLNTRMTLSPLLLEYSTIRAP